jgi:hypothetical protein
MVRKKYTIEDMQKLAEERGGKCLSEEYDGVSSKLEWQCKYGHTWKALPSNVMRGTWCPYCAGKKKWPPKE